MNPDELKRLKGVTDWFMQDGSVYGFGGLDKFADEKLLEAVLAQIGSDSEKKESKKEEVKAPVKEVEVKKSNKQKPKQEQAWKLRERRYRAWATQNGQGKMVESNEFHFLSEFFQHLEEEYDFYDLMDGVCVDEKKDFWLFEGDIVHVVGGEYYQGFHEFNVTGVFDCRGTTYCLVDFQNVLYPIDEMNLAETFEVIGHAYDKELLSQQESLARLEKGIDDEEEIVF